MDLDVRKEAEFRQDYMKRWQTFKKRKYEDASIHSHEQRKEMPGDNSQTEELSAILRATRLGGKKQDDEEENIDVVGGDMIVEEQKTTKTTTTQKSTATKPKTANPKPTILKQKQDENKT